MDAGNDEITLSAFLDIDIIIKNLDFINSNHVRTSINILAKLALFLFSARPDTVGVFIKLFRFLLMMLIIKVMLQFFYFFFK